MSSVDKIYENLVLEIIDNGEVQSNRTGVDTLKIFCPDTRMKFDLRDSFPILTTRPLPFKSTLVELEGFIKGVTDKKWYMDRGCHFWDFWCNPEKVPYGLGEKTKEAMKAERDLGEVYGYQWRGFSNECGERGPDQLLEVVEKIIQRKDDRRLIVSAWNPLARDRMALVPCFPGKTLINTESQYINIEDIAVGDYVLSDDGKLNKVYDKMESLYDDELYSLSICSQSGFPIECTKNHPFLTKRGYIEAENLSDNDYIGIPIETGTKQKEFCYSFNSNQYEGGEKLVKFTLKSKREWYSMGYFLGDGWLGQQGHFFAIATKDESDILSKLCGSLGLFKIKNSGQNCAKFKGSNLKWKTVFEEFGRGAFNKRIPDFINKGTVEQIHNFLEGYIDADGMYQNSEKSAALLTTVSPNIALGIQRLCAKVGLKCRMQKQTRPKKTIILGREVNQRDTFLISICFKEKNSTNWCYFIENNFLWCRVRKIEKKQWKGRVYNLSVENNHSYCVRNFATHNCHFAFQFGITGDFLDLIWSQRSVDVACGLPQNIVSYAALLTLVAKTANLTPRFLVGDLRDTHIYLNHLDEIKKQVAREGFLAPNFVLDNFTDLWHFDSSQAKLENYQHGEKIKYEVAV